MSCIICKSCSEKKIFTYQSTDYYQCYVCGLIRTLPFPSENQIIEHYLRASKNGNYFNLAEKSEDYIPIYKKYIDLIKKKTSLKGKRILDVGCFTGEFLDLAQDEGAITFGIELQKEAYNIASKKHPERIINSNFNSAVFSEKFDIITMFGIIEHVVDPERLLDMVSKNILNGGILIIQTPNADSLLARVLGKYWPPFTPIEHIHYFSKKNIRMFLENFNFCDIEIKSHFKKLTIEYVYCMMRTFGKEFYILLTPIFRIFPRFIKKTFLYFYVGEMIIFAKKI